MLSEYIGEILKESYSGGINLTEDSFSLLFFLFRGYDELEACFEELWFFMLLLIGGFLRFVSLFPGR